VTFVPQLRSTDERARRPLGAQEAGEDEHERLGERDGGVSELLSTHRNKFPKSPKFAPRPGDSHARLRYLRCLV
jgi:hypothetical protein